MRHLALALAALLPLASCVATAGGDDGSGDAPDVAVTASAILKGSPSWTTPQLLEFDDAKSADVDYVYLQFELSGPATVTFQTTAAAGDTADTALDTELYLYHPTATAWGRAIASDDNTGASKLSSISHALTEAGTYRVLVKRKNGEGAPHVNLVSTCTGDGCALPQIGCTTQAARAAVPELFIGPDGWEQGIEDAIDSAAGSLDVQMYLFTVTDIAQHIIAAQNRGVAVRVLLDPHEPNSAVQKLLTAANVPNKTDPTEFSYAHAKYMVIDGTTAVILSGNFNYGATSTTAPAAGSDSAERNYAVIDRDQDDAARLETIFTDDWTLTSGISPDLSCTRLIVSPINSADRILAHVTSATKTLDIEVLYLDDPTIQQAVIAAANSGTVAVRVILSDPVANPQNTATIATLKAANIPVKVLLANYLHTKMIQADGIALVGSENMSETSLTKNREVGVLIFEPTPAGQIHDQYELDWAAAVPQ